MDDKYNETFYKVFVDDTKKRLVINNFILICIGVCLALAILRLLFHEK